MNYSDHNFIKLQNKQKLRVALVLSSESSICSTSSTQPKCMGSTRRTCRVVSCRDVTSQVECVLYKGCCVVVTVTDSDRVAEERKPVPSAARGRWTYLPEGTCMVEA